MSTLKISDTLRTVADKGNPSKTKGKRVRRKPEEARALILEAARTVFGELGPDRAGLKEVAQEAGVSHGLITHYFGTFDNLVEEALRSHSDRIRDDLIHAIARSDASPQVVVELLLERLGDPRFGRLVSWALLSGRFRREDFFPKRNQGPKVIADALESALSSGGKRIDREALETLMIVVWCAAVGYSMSSTELWQFYGRQQSPERDRMFYEMTVDIVRRQLEHIAKD